MAYIRNRNYRRRYRKKNVPWYNKKYNAMQLAAKAARGVWYLKGLVNSEMKHYITANSGTVNNTGTIVNLCAISQGDSDVGNREGNSIFVRSVFSRIQCVQHASATNTQFRIIFFIDMQQVADTAPSVSNILNSTSCLSSLSTGSAGRYKILKDYCFSTNTASGTTRDIKYFTNLRHHVRFNGSADTDIQKGCLYMLFLSDQATNTPTLYWNTKIGYHDN